MTGPLVPPEIIAPPAPPTMSVGLFDAMVGPGELSDKGIGGGVRYDIDWCANARLYPAECEDPETIKVFDPAGGTVTGLPFVVYASLLCGSIGYRPREFEAKATRALVAVEQAGVEEALWGDATAPVAGIFQTMTTTTLPAAANMVEGIANLEQALADCNASKLSFIHARPRAAAHMDDAHLLNRDGTGPGARVWTGRGNRVVFGDGYSGLGSANEALDPLTEWIFGTGRVLGWRSTDIFVPPAEQTLDRTLNQQYVLAERNWVLAVECCIVAVEVTL